MTRRIPAALALGLIGALLIGDVMANPPNPYQAPAIMALGSGSAASGGFCGAMPK